jgi:hypothetical protein
MANVFRIRYWAAALVLAMVCLAPVQASAQLEELTEEQIEELKLWLSKANRLYDEGDYAGALKRYREGLDIAELPEIHYRMATCFEKLDRYAEAVKAYEKFLVLDPDAPERGRVEADIERLRGKLEGQDIGELEIKSEPAGALVFLLDGKEDAELGKTPITTPLPAGTVRIRVTLDGYEDHTQAVEVTPSGKTVVTVVLATIAPIVDPPDKKPDPILPDPKKPDPQPADDGFDYGLWGWVTTGVGVAAAASSLALWFSTNGTIADYNNYDRRGQGADRAELEELSDSISRLKTATVWTGIAAGVIVAGGVTLLVVDGVGDDGESVRIDIGPDGSATVIYQMGW